MVCINKSFVAQAVLGSIIISRIHSSTRLNINTSVTVTLNICQFIQFITALQEVSTWMHTKRNIKIPETSHILGLRIECVISKEESSKRNTKSTEKKKCSIFLNNDTVDSFYQVLPIEEKLTEEQELNIESLQCFIGNFYPLSYICFGFEYQTITLLNQFFIKLSKLSERKTTLK